MEENFVPVFYDDELIPNKLIKIVKPISSDTWFADYISLVALQLELQTLINNFKGVRHTTAFSDKVSMYSS